jgi:hypothetical protein
MGHHLRFAAIAGASLLFMACGADEDSDPIEAGLLTVEWSLLSGFDPGACATFGADAMELVIFDELGSVVTEIEAPCEDFVATIELFDGIYDADATLVDAADFAVTTSEQLNDLDILPGSELVVELDFPAASFVAGP